LGIQFGLRLGVELTLPGTGTRARIKGIPSPNGKRPLLFVGWYHAAAARHGNV